MFIKTNKILNGLPVYRFPSWVSAQLEKRQQKLLKRDETLIKKQEKK